MLPVSQIIAPTPKINPSERNYPKSLSILINTRIRGYPKLKYEPSMSVPGARSETVYFDPLIKLNNSVAGTVPKGYPPSEQFTQFFDKGAFDSLISRTLSSSFFGQGKKTIEQATESDYIDNNIKVTLNQLFKQGNRFYIKGQPFTINGYDWSYGDWQVGTKNIERRFEMSGSSYGQGINNMLQLQFSSQEEALADQELENFKAMHPESVMRGKINPNMSKFEDSELLSGVAAGVKQSSTEGKKPESTSVTENQKIQAMLPSPFVELYGRDYIREDAINLDINTPIMQSDPISLSIIYYLDRNYNEDTRKNPKLKQLYDVFLYAAKEYKSAKENYHCSFVYIPLVDLTSCLTLMLDLAQDVLVVGKLLLAHFCP